MLVLFISALVSGHSLSTATESTRMLLARAEAQVEAEVKDFDDPSGMGLGLGAFIGAAFGFFIVLDFILFMIWRIACGNYGRRSERGYVKRTEFQGDMDPVGFCNCVWSVTCKSRVELLFCSACMQGENWARTKIQEPRPAPLFKTYLYHLAYILGFPLTAGILPLYCLVQNRLDNTKRPHPDMEGTWFLPEFCKATCCCGPFTPFFSIMQVSEFIELYEEFYEGRKPEIVWESWKSGGDASSWTPEQQAEFEFQQQMAAEGGKGYG